MGLVTLPYVWVVRELVPAAYLNADFNAILNQVNGNLDASNLANLAVTTPKIAVGAVTGPKIAMGGDVLGDVLYYDGTKYVRLPAGTAGYLLQTQGTSTPPNWVGPINTLGGLSFVQSGIVMTAANFTISSLVAGAKYKLVLSFLLGTATSPSFSIQANGDSGGNYNYSFAHGTGSGDGAGGSTGSAATSILPASATNTVQNTYNLFDIDIIPVSADNKTIALCGVSSINGGKNVNAFSGQYAGASTLSSLLFAVSSGTMTGTWTLYQLS